jgi:16S rRNA (cytidine1402-2'-O)-methyltransferase
MNNVDSKGKLFIVPTPIGNLEDITLRALKILSDVDIIACEDTRTTSHLLKHFKIENKKLISCYSHNEESRISQLISLINDGKSIALVSDAGTPGISDPGVRFVSAAINENIVIVPLPGAVALQQMSLCSLGLFLIKKVGKHFLNIFLKKKEQLLCTTHLIGF